MERLERTRTNAATDSKGQAFGLSGNLFLYPITGVVAGLLSATLCFSAFHLNLVVSILVALPFLILPTLYVAVLRHNKPRGYDRDWIDNAFSTGFSLVKGCQPPNPRCAEGEDE